MYVNIRLSEFKGSCGVTLSDGVVLRWKWEGYSVIVRGNCVYSGVCKIEGQSNLIVCIFTSYMLLGPQALMSVK